MMIYLGDTMFLYSVHEYYVEYADFILHITMDYYVFIYLRNFTTYCSTSMSNVNNIECILHRGSE
jgi:hypothetical protein